MLQNKKGMGSVCNFLAVSIFEILYRECVSPRDGRTGEPLCQRRGISADGTGGRIPVPSFILSPFCANKIMPLLNCHTPPSVSLPGYYRELWGRFLDPAPRFWLCTFLLQVPPPSDWHRQVSSSPFNTSTPTNVGIRGFTMVWLPP